MSAGRLDLLCVGYLADAQVLRAGSYPPAKRSATVNDWRKDVDGPPAASRLLLPRHAISELHGVSR